jgi:hypothetical protein
MITLSARKLRTQIDRAIKKTSEMIIHKSEHLAPSVTISSHH